MYASSRRHLDVVNRLLDCKEIDVNVQDKVKWECFDFRHIPSPKLSSLFYFVCVFFLVKILVMIKNVAWKDRTDLRFTGRTFGCGQSTIGLQRN